MNFKYLTNYVSGGYDKTRGRQFSGISDWQACQTLELGVAGVRDSLESSAQVPAFEGISNISTIPEIR